MKSVFLPTGLALASAIGAAWGLFGLALRLSQRRGFLQEGKDTMANGDLRDLLSLYGIVFEALRHESNGIWNRFNIVLGMNLALFGGVGLACFGASRPVSWRAFGISISVGGVLIIAWSWYVLRQLWERHRHWRQCLEQVQTSFPAGWVRPIDQRQPSAVDLTEPYLWVVGIGWLALLIAFLVCPGVFTPR